MNFDLMKNEKKFDLMNSTSWKNEFWSHEIRPLDPESNYQFGINFELHIVHQHCIQTPHAYQKKLNFLFCILWFLSTTSHEQCFLVDDFFISVLIDLRSRNFNKKQHSHSFANKGNSKLTLIVLLLKNESVMCWKIIHNTQNNIVNCSKNTVDVT